MEPKVLINGREIKSLSDLPENIRNILADDNDNGIPDIAENPFAMLGKLGDMKNLSKNMPEILQGLLVNPQDIRAQKIMINGQEYKSWGEVPEGTKAEMKAKFQELKNMPPPRQTPAPGAPPSVESSQVLSRTPAHQKSEIPVTDNPAIQEKQDSNRRTLFILALLAFAGWIIYQYFGG